VLRGQEHRATRSAYLTESAQGQGVVSLPNSAAGRTLLVVARTTTSQTSGLLSSSGVSAHFSVLVCRIADPVNAGIVTDSVVRRIDADDFIVVIGGVFVDPVGVQDAQVSAGASDLTLGNDSVGLLVLQFHDTVVLGLTINNT